MLCAKHTQQLTCEKTRAHHIYMNFCTSVHMKCFGDALLPPHWIYTERRETTEEPNKKQLITPNTRIHISNHNGKRANDPRITVLCACSDDSPNARGGELWRAVQGWRSHMCGDMGNVHKITKHPINSSGRLCRVCALSHALFVEISVQTLAL